MSRSRKRPAQESPALDGDPLRGNRDVEDLDGDEAVVADLLERAGDGREVGVAEAGALAVRVVGVDMLQMGRALSPAACYGCESIERVLWSAGPPA